MEIWKRHNHNYEVSNYGRIRKGGCIIKQHYNLSGLLSIVLDKKRYLTHRLVAQYFIPNENNGRYVKFKDGNKHNVRWTNLYWSDKKSSYNRGEKNVFCVLTSEDVFNIRKLRREDKMSLKTIANKYNIHINHVVNIVNYKCWNNGL